MVEMQKGKEGKSLDLHEKVTYANDKLDLQVHAVTSRNLATNTFKLTKCDATLGVKVHPELHMYLLHKSQNKCNDSVSLGKCFV